jgi:hypothetical protein
VPTKFLDGDIVFQPAAEKTAIISVSLAMFFPTLGKLGAVHRDTWVKFFRQRIAAA